MNRASREAEGRRLAEGSRAGGAGARATIPGGARPSDGERRMKIRLRLRLRLVLKIAGWALALLLVAGLVAPYLTADQYRARLEASMERALGRRVELGRVTFSLFSGPGFSVDSVTIHEDPSIGLEPIVYVQDPGSMEVVPSIWSLLGGRFVIASIRLSYASINLTKSGPASEPGRWNFSSFVNRSVMSRRPPFMCATGASISSSATPNRSST